MKTSKMISVLGLLLAIAFLPACTKVDLPEATPECVEEKIKEQKKGSKSNHSDEVYQATYNGETVYYFSAVPEVDGMSTLYDATCVVVCSPDGGLSGKGDEKCSDFSLDNGILIWERD